MFGAPLWLQVFEFDLFGIYSWLAGILNTIVGWIVQIFEFLWQALRTLADYLWSAILVTVNFILKMLSTVGRFFRALWENVIKKGLLHLVSLYQRLKATLARIFGPILRILRRIRAFIDYWYFRIFGPILNLIQRVRAILVVFRIFNLKWARRLDERLLRLEGKLTGPFLLIRRYLNMIATTINLVLDPELILRKNVLAASLLKFLGAVKRIVGFGDDRALTIQEEESQKRDRERYHQDEVEKHARALMESGPTEEDVQMRQAARAALEEMIGAPLQF